jgi:hypothetical protein
LLAISATRPNAKVRKILVHRAPYDLVLHDRIAMDEDVPEGDDLAEIRDAGGRHGIDFRELCQRLAQNHQLPLDGGMQQLVAGVVIERLARDEGGDCICRSGPRPTDRFAGQAA